ncbi:hypothetical protein DFH07DRAFT_907605 [Mycena maculata]|uniref:Uncharacterized protein n=1 Tax=Mycena maculata TaxID=230809 RepID=A0AAD7KHL9_9AGAR|nr:hypothetical protein DFH07DRAFT_907605 [Mycena maculata]
MSIALTFTARDLLNSTVVGAEGGVHYNTMTTKGIMGRKVTTINAASGLVGMINWREKEFVINGVQRKWDDIKARSGGLFSSEREWNWGPRPFNLKYHDSHKELLATPLIGNPADTVRFLPYHGHLFHENERAIIHFPYHMQDEFEKMFLFMAIVETEIHRQDQNRDQRDVALLAAE